MTRLKADLALGLAGLIWGFGFVAQKVALDHIGPLTFVAVRFLISAILVLPLAIWSEKGFARLKAVSAGNALFLWAVSGLCLTFAAAVLLQQYGLTATTVTHAAFLTGLYAVMVPFVGYLLYRHKLSALILIASLLSVLGVWLLSGGSVRDLQTGFGLGDGLVLLCALCFALQVAIMGHTVDLVRAPFLLSFLQYLATAVVAFTLMFLFEPVRIEPILHAWIPILYAGVASGGIAYTLQAVAQQHTPSADTAIILSSEALFGGLGGVWLMKDKLTASGAIGCGAIMAAIVLVELGPFLKKTRSRRSRPAAG